jgi:Ca2+-binding EF-hand superfamily protein
VVSGCKIKKVLARNTFTLDADSIEEIFKIFADSDNEFIDAQSLHNVLQELGENLSEKEAQDLIHEASIHCCQNKDNKPALSKKGICFFVVYCLRK